MRIKSKLALVLALAGGLLLVFVLLDRNQLDGRTAQFQEDRAAEKLQAFDTVFELIRAPYHGYVVDMTFWDELVDFISVQDPEWADPNIDSSAETFDIDFILVFNLQHELVYAYTDEERPVLANQVKGIIDWDAVFQEGERFCNYHLQIGAKLFEIDGATIHPTEDPERKTAPHGYFVIGKEYGNDFLMEIADATGSEIQLNLRGAKKDAERQIVVEDGMIHITRPLPNASGEPIATLKAAYDDASLTSFAGFVRDHHIAMACFFAAMGLIVVSLASYWIQQPLSRIGGALADENITALKDHGDHYRDFNEICGVLIEGMEHHHELEREMEERIAAEVKLSEARDEAERANRAKSEFLANMSHEIRTPMNAVMGFTELAREKVTDSDAREYLGHIEHGGKMMLSLIDDILDMSKIEAGKMSLQPRPTNLQQMLSDICGLFVVNAKRKGLAFENHIKRPGLPSVMMDPAKFRQIMVNLIGNAIKFTDEGSVRVELNWERIGGRHAEVEVVVIDTGIGIKEGQHARIFDTFIQQDGQDAVKYGGTGLGLSLSQKVARMMGAQISVESEEGKGSRFALRWPRLAFAELEESSSPADSQQPTKGVLDGVRVLVAEDDAASRMLLNACLSKAGAQVAFGNDGEEAWLALEKESVDLIISDLQMPELDGMGLLERVKASAKTKDVPFLMMSATVTNETRDKAMALGGKGCLSKPVPLDELLKVCSEALS